MLFKILNRFSKTVLCFSFFLGTLISFAGNKSRIDSLEAYSKEANDVDRLEIYNKLSKLYIYQSDYKSFYYADSAYKIAVKTNSINGIITSLNNLGIVAKNMGNYAKALSYSMRALNYCQLVHDKYETARALKNIGDVYFIQKNNQEAITKYNAAYDLYKEINNKEGIIDALLEIGEIYLLRLNNTKALENFNKALDLSKEITDSNRIAQSYIQMGKWYRYNFKYTTAIDYFTKAEIIFKSTNNIRGLINTFENKGIAFFSNGEYNKSIDFHNKSYELADSMGEKILILSSYSNLYTAYYGISDYKEALKYMVLYNKLKDSIIAQSSKQIFQMQLNYEKERSINEIKVLEKQKELVDIRLKQNVFYINVFIFSFCILLIVLFFGIYEYFQKRKKNRILNAQKDLIIWEKMQSETLLLNILPYEISEELKIKGKATVRHYEMVSVMFADFKEFSLITEQISPDILIAELDKYFIKFDEIISKYNLEKIKTIGDCYMCVGGIPNPNKSNPIEAVLAAMEFQQYVKECNQVKAEKKETLWEIRIGIHTGKVIAGVVGKKKFAYDIWGDTVNTASRIESGSEVGKVNISGATYEAVKDYFDCTYRGKMDVKNKKEMDMYYVDRIKPFYSKCRQGLVPNGNLKRIITPTAKLDIDTSEVELDIDIV